MGAASYNTDLTDLIADSSNTSNWAAIGSGASGLNIETDYFIEGTRCVSKNAWAGATKGMIEDTTLNTLSTGSGKAVYTWVTHHTPGSLAVKSSGGISVVLGSDSSTYNVYDYAGSDTIDYGAPWLCALVDPDEATQSAGTVTVANIDCYGATANLPVGGPTKGAPFGVDEIRYGRSIEINDGVGASATFTALAAANDAITARWGQFQRVPGSTTNFIMQCRLEFGDTTNTTACEFDDSNKNIEIPDLEHVATDFIEFDVTQGSDVTLTNINITAVAGGNTRGNWVNTSAGTIVLAGCTFTNMGTFEFDSNYDISMTFRGCGQITLGGGSLDDCLIDKSTAASAVLTTTLNDVTDCTFISDGTGHAIELTSIGTGTMSWNSVDSGYAATDGTTGNETIYINVTSSTDLTINKTGAGTTTPTIRKAAGYTGTVTVAASVTLDVNVKDQSGSNISSALVYIDEDLGSAGNITNTTTDANGNITQASYSGAETSATLRVRKYGYKPFVATVTLTANSATNVTLITDPQQT